MEKIKVGFSGHGGFTPEHQDRYAGRGIPFTDDELFAVGPQKTYTGKYLNEIAFSLGGIGTGCVSLSGREQLVDWEIFNRPPICPLHI